MPISPLATPLRLPNGSVLANRFCKSAMTEAMADKMDNPTPALNTLYQRWAQGGLGLQITGNVMVDRRYLERPGNVVIEDESNLDAVRAWAASAKSETTQVWMQISHPGRQCPIVVNSTPLSPSTEKLQLLGLFGQPKEMSPADINETIGRYAETARIALKAGFDGVQIHGAHGYLISQFLSPRTNHRTDKWGGSLENRARFLRAIIAETRQKVGADCPIGVKLNSADFQKGGFSFDDCKQVARWLEEDGIDLLEISGGTYEEMRFATATDDTKHRESTRKREAFFLEYAHEIRSEITLPLVVTGGFRHVAAMEAALVDGIDMIGLARPLCLTPDAASEILDGQITKIGMDETDLALGRGKWGNNTKNALMNLFNTVVRVEFYAAFMTRMAKGEPLNAQRDPRPINLLLGYFWFSTYRAIRRKPYATRRTAPALLDSPAQNP
ncbi:MAG: NADH:flavin oxidoreductase/NADH oxidase family protein [Pseudoruegeria sp.]